MKKAALAFALLCAACGDDSATGGSGGTGGTGGIDAAMPDAAPPDAAPPDAATTGCGTGTCPLTPVTPPGTCERTFGANERDSNDAANYMQNGETSIASDGQGHVVVVWIASTANDHTGVAYSDDNGVTFTRGPELGMVNQEHNDPVVIAENDGSFLVTWLGYDLQGGTDHIWAARSTDHGHTFSAQVQVNDAANSGLDKPWLYQANDAAHTIFVTYDAGNNNQFDYLVSSTDGGLTWSRSVQISENAQNASNLARMAADATHLYVSYVDVQGNDLGDTRNKIYVRRMTLGTTTFDAAVVASAPGDSIVFQDPTIVATGTAQLTMLYTSGHLADTGASTRIRVRHTADGVTWTDGGFVDDDGCGGAHMLPELRAGADGRLHALFYDNRFGNPDGVLWYSHTESPTGAFESNQFVNDMAFPFTSNRMTNSWLGDYVGMHVQQGKIFASWTDPRNGMQSQVYVANGTP
jgi:hypothetical protein